MLSMKTHLKRFNIVGDYHKLSFLLFHQFGDGVGARSEYIGFLGRSVGFFGYLRLSASLQALLLLQLSFGPVLLQQFKDLCGCNYNYMLNQLFSSQHTLIY